MQEERIKLLISKYLAQDLTAAENQELDYFISLHPSLPGLLKKQGNPDLVSKALQKMTDTDTGKNLGITLDRIQRHQNVQKRTRQFSGAALGILILCIVAAGIYRWWPAHSPGVPASGAETIANTADIGPGKNRANLILADGRKVGLDSIAVGPIGVIADVNVRKLDSTTLSYTGSSTEGMHILETPRAGTFKVILPDGTKVWLNNESRLQYPPSFTGAERTVLLTGEAYFEVAPDKQHPFRVKVGELAVNVLGTHFNVSAYPDEKKVTTTLLAGSVKLDKDDAHIILKPGEQGVFIPGRDQAEMQVLQHIDTDNIIAWKEGKFYFFHADLPSVLRQLARWYNVDIVFQGPPSNKPYDLERKRSNIDLFWILDQWNLHHHWEGKKLIVTE